MPRRTVVESSVSRSSRLVRLSLCSLLLAGLLVSGLACQAPGRATGPTRAPLQSPRDVRGMVADADGQPVAGVAVTAYAARPQYVYTQETLREVGSQTTGPDGTFRFPVSRDVSKLVFVAIRPGAGFGWSGWQESQPGTPIVVQMAPPAELAGRVVDHQRQPVPAATVSISVGDSHEPTVNLGNCVPSLAVRTDAQGKFRFENLPAGQSVHLEVVAAGHGRFDTVRTQEDGYLAGQTDVELQMPESATVEVTMVSKVTGKPLRGVPLLAFARGLAHEMVGTPVPGHPGHVRWTDLPPGPVAVFTATPLDRPTGWTGSMTRMETVAGKTTEAKMELSRGQVVEILARDAKTGQPIKGHTASMFSPQLKSGGLGYGDREGVARLTVMPGEYPHVATEAPLYRAYKAEKPIKVEAGKPLRLDVTLERVPCYQGTVVGPDARAVPGATVAVLGQLPSTITDATGRFEIYPPFYDTARTPVVTLLARKASSNLAACLEVPAPDKPLEIRLRPAGVREVNVCDGDGKPIAGAAVTVTLGQDDVRPVSGLFHAFTDAAGRCAVRALPAGCPLAVCVQAKGYVAEAQLVDGASAAASRVRLQKVQQLSRGPAVKEIAIPETPQQDSIWGATGRDSRGHIWFAVSKRNSPGVSANLFEFVPESGKVIDRGNVLDELKRAGLARPDQQQMKIHSKIYEVDGYLYFVSMDEKGEDEQKLLQPVFGSHLWRYRLSDNTWEHLLTIPQAMVGIAVGGGKVYCLGYWDHALYQYDIATGASKSIKIGTCFGHVSRNVIADSRGHVYAPRCSLVAGMPHAELVEFDEQLCQVASTPLPLYFRTSANNSYGVTALQPLAVGSIAMLTHNGWLTIIRPQENGPAKVEHLGWFHPDGARMADSLFLDKTGRCLMGAVMTRTWQIDWVTYDLQTGQRTVAPLSDGAPDNPSWGRGSVYGCQTQDDQGNCYVVGFAIRPQELRPLLLQVSPTGPQPDAVDAMAK